MKGKKHKPEQIITKLRETDATLGIKRQRLHASHVAT